MGKSLLIVSLCWMVSSLSGWTSRCSAVSLTAEEAAYLTKTHTIVFVSQTQYPPFEFIDENGQHEGMMLDVIRWMAMEMGFKPIFKDMTFHQAQEAVLTGKADILTSLFYSEKREEKFRFTAPLFKVPASIFVKIERTDIKALSDLNGKIIAIQQGDYAKDFLESRNIHFFTLFTKNFAEATDQVAGGHADAVIGDEQIVYYYIFKNRLTSTIKKVGEPLYIGENCMASDQNHPVLINILNKGIREAVASGKLEKIETKWLGALSVSPKSFVESYGKRTAAIFGSILLVLLWIWIWNIRLRTKVREKTAAIVHREESLRQSEEKYRLLFETLIDIYYRIDRKGKIVMISPSIAKIAGYLPDEVMGTNAVDYYLDPQDSEKSLNLILRNGFINNFEARVKRKDGTFIWASFNARVIRNASGRSIGFEGIIRDITERRRADDAVKAALQEKDVLLREIHHRVKNNMQVINSLLNLQARRIESNALRQMLLESQQRITTMAMIHETLYGSANLSRIDLSAYIKNLIFYLSGIFNRLTEIEVIQEIDPVELGIDEAVPCGLIINELVTNAFRHAFPDGRKGTVRIRAHLPNSGEMMIEVTDDGVGLPEDMDLSNFASLGLKLAKGLAEHQLKGSMTIASRGGTAFILRWPLANAEGEDT